MLSRPSLAAATRTRCATLFRTSVLAHSNTGRRTNATAAAAAASSTADAAAPAPASRKTGYNAPTASASTAHLAKQPPTADTSDIRSKYELWIGIETHAQVLANTKLFSSASTSFHAAPNSCVALLDAAVPGALPRLNAHCVAAAARTGLALGGTVAETTRFDRKHYFYCDMPLGYQITQQLAPIVTGGALSVDAFLPPPSPAATALAVATGICPPTQITGNANGKAKANSTTAATVAATGKSVRIARIQLEQDSGKSLHDVAPGLSHVDLNRAGSALLEIVTEPDMRSADEAVAYLRSLQQLLRCVGASGASMEDGTLRCDINVTVRRRYTPEETAASNGNAAAVKSTENENSGASEMFPSDRTGGVTVGPMTGRVELKNMNSLRAIARAINYEYHRQATLTEAGEAVDRETRSFDSKSGETARLRAKEDLLDYRFLPEPDLPPLRLARDWVEGQAASLPPLPDALFARFTGPGYGLARAEAALLLQEPGAAAFLRALVGDGDDDVLRREVKPHGDGAAGVAATLARPARVCWGWLCSELLGKLKKLRGPGVAETRGGAMALQAQALESSNSSSNNNNNNTTNAGEADEGAEGGVRDVLLTSPVCPARLGALIDLVSSGAVSGKQAKELLDAMVFQNDPRSPAEIAQERGMVLDSDETRLRALCEQIVAVYEDEVAKYRAGRTNMLGFLCGQAIRLSKVQAEAGAGGGEANPKVVAEIMAAVLGPVQKKGKN